MVDDLNSSDSSYSEGGSSSSSGSSSSDSSSSDSSSSESSSSDSDEDEPKEVGRVASLPAVDEAIAAESLTALAGTETGDMADSDDEVSVVTHEPIFNPYPKVEDNTVLSDEDYKGHEYAIVSNCRRELYEECPDMKISFGKFAVSKLLFGSTKLMDCYQTK
jgi:hypothetical protein